jgi:hypothetical protein
MTRARVVVFLFGSARPLLAMCFFTGGAEMASRFSLNWLYSITSSARASSVGAQ